MKFLGVEMLCHTKASANASAFLFQKTPPAEGYSATNMKIRASFLVVIHAV